MDITNTERNTSALPSAELGVVDAKTMLEELEKLRRNLTDDTVLDLMDRIWGWCSPHAKLSRDAD